MLVVPALGVPLVHLEPVVSPQPRHAIPTGASRFRAARRIQVQWRRAEVRRMYREIVSHWPAEDDLSRRAPAGAGGVALLQHSSRPLLFVESSPVDIPTPSEQFLSRLHRRLS